MTVCGALSSLVHVTVVPLWTVSVAGENAKLLIVTVAVADNFTEELTATLTTGWVVVAGEGLGVELIFISAGEDVGV